MADGDALFTLIALLVCIHVKFGETKFLNEFDKCLTNRVVCLQTVIFFGYIAYVNTVGTVVGLSLSLSLFKEIR